MRGDRVRARSRRRDLPKNGRARVHEVESGWMAGAGRAHPACAKGREALADASRRRISNAVDAAPGDPKAKRCDAVRRFSLNGKTLHFDPWIERFVDFCTAPGVSGTLSCSPSPVGEATDLGPRVRDSVGARKGVGKAQRSNGVGAVSIVPEGDASEHVPATVAVRRWRRQR